MLRQPAVAGYFYKASPEALKAQVRGFIVPGASRKRAFGVLSPHAGLQYSGAVAGAVYSGLELPDTIILIGPNHTGLGAPVSLMTEGAWKTPLGTVTIDAPLAAAILSASPRIHEDSLAHLHEHSLEVQLPFIQCLKEDFRIVPIQMLDARLDTCLEVGRAVGEAIQKCGMRNAEKNFERRTLNSGLPLIVASSDMSHYERAEVAKEKDFKAIQRILALDPKGLFQTVREHGITMCGYGPAVAMLVACALLGASRAELVRYANSGEVSGDFERVVGYAGILVV
jgi:MEMO1 family protein